MHPSYSSIQWSRYTVNNIEISHKQRSSLSSIHLIRHLYSYTCALYWNKMLNSPLYLVSHHPSIHPSSQYILCPCKHALRLCVVTGQNLRNTIKLHLSCSAVIKSVCTEYLHHFVVSKMKKSFTFTSWILTGQHHRETDNSYGKG